MIIDHICIGVRSIGPAAKSFCKMFGYTVKTEKVTNTRQQVNVQFLHKENSMDIKLIEPVGRSSPLCNFLKKGGGLHHICFMTDDVNKAVADVKEKGARVLAAPEPGEAFDEELIAFLFAGNGLNVELIDTDKRRSLIDKTQD